MAMALRVGAEADFNFLCRLKRQAQYEKKLNKTK
jgi:hypothetical protein